MRRTLACIVIAAMAATAAAEIDPNLLITDGGPTGFPWTKTDGAGFAWDIGLDGGIDDGVNDAYDGGMRLNIAGAYFDIDISKVKLNTADDELQLGPWETADGLVVYRRIRVAKTKGYCRYVDIFHNPADETKTVGLKYASNMGARSRTLATTSGADSISDADWGAVTGDESDQHRPAVGHVFASPSAKIKPSFASSPGSDRLHYRIQLEIPAGKTSALCLFEFQRSSWPEARRALKDFHAAKELTNLPTALREIVVNVSGSVTAVGDIAIDRSKTTDRVKLAKGGELEGKLLGESYTLETAIGVLTVPAKTTAGLTSDGPDRVRLMTIDGQVITGRLTGGRIRLQTSDGAIRELKPNQIVDAAYRVGSDRPEQTAASHPTLVFRNGDRLTFKAAQRPWTFLTQFARMELRQSSLAEIRLTDAGRLHQVLFADGGRFAGVLLDKQFECTLVLGSTVDVKAKQLATIVFPHETIDMKGMRNLTFRNGDILRGALAETQLKLATADGNRQSAVDTISELSAVDHGMIRLSNADGSALTGKIATRTLTVRSPTGVEMTIPTTLLAAMTVVDGAEGEATASGAKPAESKAAPQKHATTPQGHSTPPRASSRPRRR